MNLGKVENGLSNTTKRFPALKSSYLWCGIALVIVFSIYSFSYIFNVIMPQQGWWQYYAWRINEGDVLYKDVYLFIPPYYPLLTSLLYKVFGNHFILYTLFVGYPVKILCILLMYRCICRIIHPFYAFLSVFAGAYFSAAFLMDAFYDYNPILMLPCLLIADNFMRFYEKNKLINVSIIGLCVGVLLMSKQSFGIPFAIISIIMLIVLHKKEKIPHTCHSLLFWGSGVAVGVLPGIIYLVKNQCISDFINCMLIATDAKGGVGGLITHLLDAFYDKSQWIVAISVFLLYYLSQNKKISNLTQKRSITLICFLIITVCIRDCFFFFKGLCQTDQELHWSLSIIPIFLFGVYLYRKRESLQLNGSIFGIFFILLLVISIYLISKTPPEVSSLIYNTADLMTFRRIIIRMMSYAFLLFWISELISYFVIQIDKDYKVLMFMTIIGVHFLIGVMSASGIEEIFMLLYMPFSFAYLFSCKPDLWDKHNGLLAILICLGAMLSLICKLYIPYDWQGWRVDSISQSDVVCTVNGLEGLKASESTNDTYQNFYNLIMENTDENDTVYQFANIPLFNVLTERKIPTYGVISWFDVCPDSVAEADAEFLCNNMPKMVIWHNMDEGEWDLLESVFRNGKTSGQRIIKDKFYEKVVKNNYTMIAEESNRRDGTIQLWLLNE